MTGLYVFLFLLVLSLWFRSLLLDWYRHKGLKEMIADRIRVYLFHVQVDEMQFAHWSFGRDQSQAEEAMKIEIGPREIKILNCQEVRVSDILIDNNIPAHGNDDLIIHTLVVTMEEMKKIMECSNIPQTHTPHTPLTHPSPLLHSPHSQATNPEKSVMPGKRP